MAKSFLPFILIIISTLRAMTEEQFTKMQQNRHSSLEKLGDATSKPEEITKEFLEHIRKLFFHELTSKEDLSDVIVDYLTLDLKSIVGKEDFPIKKDADADILIQQALEKNSKDLFNGDLTNFMEQLNKIFVYYTIFLLAENKENDFGKSFQVTAAMIQELLKRIDLMWKIQIGMVNAQLSEHYKKIIGNMNSFKTTLISKVNSFHKVDLKQNIYNEYSSYQKARDQSIPLIKHEVLLFIHRIGKKVIPLNGDNYENLNDKAYHMIKSILKIVDNSNASDEDWIKILNFMVVFLITERKSFVNDINDLYSRWNLYLIKRLILLIRSSQKDFLSSLISDLFLSAIERDVDASYSEFVTKQYLASPGLKILNDESTSSIANNLKIVDVILHTNMGEIITEKDLNEIAQNVDILYLAMMNHMSSYKKSVNLLKNTLISYAEEDFYNELRNLVFNFRVINKSADGADFGVDLDVHLDKLYEENHSEAMEKFYIPMKLQNVITLMMDKSNPFTFASLSKRTITETKGLLDSTNFKLYDLILQNLYVLKLGQVKESSINGKEYIPWIEQKPFNTDDILKFYSRTVETKKSNETKTVSLKDPAVTDDLLNTLKIKKFAKEDGISTPKKILIDSIPEDLQKEKIALNSQTVLKGEIPSHENLSKDEIDEQEIPTKFLNKDDEPSTHHKKKKIQKKDPVNDSNTSGISKSGELDDPNDPDYIPENSINKPNNKTFKTDIVNQNKQKKKAHKKKRNQEDMDSDYDPEEDFEDEFEHKLPKGKKHQSNKNKNKPNDPFEKHDKEFDSLLKKQAQKKHRKRKDNDSEYFPDPEEDAEFEKNFEILNKKNKNKNIKNKEEEDDNDFLSLQDSNDDSEYFPEDDEESEEEFENKSAKLKKEGSKNKKVPQIKNKDKRTVGPLNEKIDDLDSSIESNDDDSDYVPEEDDESDYEEDNLAKKNKKRAQVPKKNKKSPNLSDSNDDSDYVPEEEDDESDYEEDTLAKKNKKRAQVPKKNKKSLNLSDSNDDSDYVPEEDDESDYEEDKHKPKTKKKNIDKTKIDQKLNAGKPKDKSKNNDSIEYEESDDNDSDYLPENDEEFEENEPKRKPKKRSNKPVSHDTYKNNEDKENVKRGKKPVNPKFDKLEESNLENPLEKTSNSDPLIENLPQSKDNDSGLDQPQALNKGSLDTNMKLIEKELENSHDFDVTSKEINQLPNIPIKTFETPEIIEDEENNQIKAKKGVKKFIEVDEKHHESPSKNDKNTSDVSVQGPSTEANLNKIQVVANGIDNIVELLSGSLSEEDLDYLRKKEDLEEWLKSGPMFFDKDGYLTQISYVKIIPVKSECYKALMNK